MIGHRLWGMVARMRWFLVNSAVSIFGTIEIAGERPEFLKETGLRKQWSICRHLVRQQEWPLTARRGPRNLRRDSDALTATRPLSAHTQQHRTIGVYNGLEAPHQCRRGSGCLPDRNYRGNQSATIAVSPALLLSRAVQQRGLELLHLPLLAAAPHWPAVRRLLTASNPILCSADSITAIRDLGVASETIPRAPETVVRVNLNLKRARRSSVSTRGRKILLPIDEPDEADREARTCKLKARRGYRWDLIVSKWKEHCPPKPPLVHTVAYLASPLSRLSPVFNISLGSLCDRYTALCGATKGKVSRADFFGPVGISPPVPAEPATG
ncbi:hypothetical protein VTN96DRAFT_3704 [Rasamsonia emersonii]